MSERWEEMIRRVEDAGVDGEQGQEYERRKGGETRMNEGEQCERCDHQADPEQEGLCTRCAEEQEYVYDMLREEQQRNDPDDQCRRVEEGE